MHEEHLDEDSNDYLGQFLDKNWDDNFFEQLDDRLITN